MTKEKEELTFEEKIKLLEELVKELEKFKKCNKVGVIAGASTPEETINKVISILKNA